MIINHNIAALNTYRQLSTNNTNTQKSLEKLSSGLRINRAGDDAAGLAISEKMRGQIRGLDQASRNAQDGISLIQTAEGALNETHSILQRMRELAVQSSNDTATDADRVEIQKEMIQLKEEIDRISNDTEFNTKKLLNGSVGINANIDSAATLTLQPVKVSDSSIATDTYTVTSANPATIGADIKTNTTSIADTDFTMTSGDIAGLELGDYKLVVKDAAGGNFDFYLYNDDGVEVASVAGVDIASADAVLTGASGEKFTIGTGASVQAGEMTFNLNATYANASDFTVENSAGSTLYDSAAGLKITSSRFEAGGFEFRMTVDTALDTATDSADIVVTNNALTMHIGSNENQTMKVDINKVDTTSLGINAIDVTTQAGAESAITKVNDAIEQVSAERSKLGSFQNRLDHTINNLGTSSENLTAAESRIRDVDMAKEMMEYTKMNILSQAAQAMLAQANQQPEGVLQLLR